MDSIGFIAAVLSHVVDNFAERIHKIKFKHEYDNNKCGKCGIKHTNCEH